MEINNVCLYLNESERQMVKIMQKILDRYGIPRFYYFFGKDVEGATCIRKEKEWQVYNFERNKRRDCVYCQTFLNVCKEVIYRMAKSEEDFSLLYSEFCNEYRRKKRTVLVASTYKSSRSKVHGYVRISKVGNCLSKSKTDEIMVPIYKKSPSIKDVELKQKFKSSCYDKKNKK